MQQQIRDPQSKSALIVGGCSSAGRAPALHAGGHRFEPVHLHHDQHRWIWSRWGTIVRKRLIYYLSGRLSGLLISSSSIISLKFQSGYGKAISTLIFRQNVLICFMIRTLFFDNLFFFKHEANTGIRCDHVIYFMAKLLRAHGGCLGTKRRRKTWLAAISFGELLNKL